MFSHCTPLNDSLGGLNNRNANGSFFGNCCLNFFVVVLQFHLASQVFRFLTDYKFRKDEIFKRMKPTTFAQLVSLVMGTHCLTSSYSYIYDCHRSS